MTENFSKLTSDMKPQIQEIDNSKPNECQKNETQAYYLQAAENQ